MAAEAQTQQGWFTRRRIGGLIGSASAVAGVWKAVDFVWGLPGRWEDLQSWKHLLWSANVMWPTLALAGLSGMAWAFWPDFKILRSKVSLGTKHVRGYRLQSPFYHVDKRPTAQRLAQISKRESKEGTWLEQDMLALANEIFELLAERGESEPTEFQSAPYEYQTLRIFRARFHTRILDIEQRAAEADYYLMLPDPVTSELEANEVANALTDCANRHGLPF